MKALVVEMQSPTFKSTNSKPFETNVDFSFSWISSTPFFKPSSSLFEICVQALPRRLTGVRWIDCSRVTVSYFSVNLVQDHSGQPGVHPHALRAMLSISKERDIPINAVFKVE